MCYNGENSFLVIIKRKIIMNKDIII